MEFALGANPMIRRLSAAPVSVEDGMIAVPAGPGLGLEIDTAAPARFARDG